MVFSSLLFLYLFFPLNLLFYFLFKSITYRNAVLIVFSLIFYAWGEPVWISLLIVSTMVDYFNGLIIERNRGTWKMKAALIASLVLNLSLLGFFKYSGFITENLNMLLSTHIPHSTFSLPIGISFYTFQALSYVIDVYRNETKAQTSYMKFLLFVSLFHQLVAGPIVRYSDIANEIDNRQVTAHEFYKGINRFVVGLGKKVILANMAGEIAEPFLVGDMKNLSTAGAWMGMILFSLQIYFDFSGYSDMAIGMGWMIGFHYKENFMYPYTSRSATEFWRRWHISLGTFFRDYLYIPLGGNRRHLIRNLLIVWFLTGLWHGASWNFVLWGLFYGGFIILEKLFLGEFLKKLPTIMSHLYLLFIVVIGWVFFYFTRIQDVFSYLGIMFGSSRAGLYGVEDSIVLSNNALFFVIAFIGCTPLMSILWRKLQEWLSGWKYRDWVPALWHPVLNTAVILICTSFLVGKSYNPFLYFRF